MNMLNALKTKAAKAILITVACTGIGVGTVAFAQSPEKTETTKVSKQDKSHKHGKRAKFKNMTPAQRTAWKKQRINKRIARMTKKLGLSESQAKQVRQVMEASHKEIAQARKQNDDRASRKKAIKAIRKAYKPELEKILTAEQKKQWQSMRKNRKHRHGKRRGKRMKKLMKQLNLTAAQQTKIKAIRTKQRTQRKALIAKANGDKKSIKPQLKALRKSSRTQIKAVLTAEQQTKFKSLRKNHKKGLDKGNGKGPF